MTRHNDPKAPATMAGAFFAPILIFLLLTDYTGLITACQVYEQSVKPLSVAEKLTLVQLIIDDIVPLNQLETHAVIDLLPAPIDNMVADYMPEDEKEI